jgi:hypothetical protein
MLEIIPSKGASGAVKKLIDNFIIPKGILWPPLEIATKYP